MSKANKGGHEMSEKASKISKAIFKKFDANNNQYIDQNEFQRVFGDILRNLEVTDEQMIENTLNQWFIAVAGEHDGEDLITEGEMEHFIKSKFIPLLKGFMGRDISHYEISGMVRDLLDPIDQPDTETTEPQNKVPPIKQPIENKEPTRQTDKKQPLKNEKSDTTKQQPANKDSTQKNEQSKSEQKQKTKVNQQEPEVAPKEHTESKDRENEARQDLKELLGREPSQHELDDWINEFYPNDDEETTIKENSDKLKNEDNKDTNTEEEKPGFEDTLKNDPLNNDIMVVPPSMDDPLKDYVQPIADSSGSYNSLFLLIVIAAAAIIYKFRKQLGVSGADEDQFQKSGRADKYDSFSNPFDRGNGFNRRGRRDNDNDDYDRHV